MQIEQCGNVIKYEDDYQECSIEIDSKEYTTGFDMVLRIGDDDREVKLDPLTVSVMINQLQKIKQLQEKGDE